MGDLRHFFRGATSKCCISFLGCWGCNANVRSLNALPFRYHNENSEWQQSHKCAWLAAIARHIVIIYTMWIDHPHIFSEGRFFSMKHCHGLWRTHKLCFILLSLETHANVTTKKVANVWDLIKSCKRPGNLLYCVKRTLHKRSLIHSGTLVTVTNSH